MVFSHLHTDTHAHTNAHTKKERNGGNEELGILELLHALGKAGFHTSGTAPHVHIDALDKGGVLGSDQIGLVGENGPELVSGPGAVTSRNNTNQLFEKMNKNLEHLIVLTKESNYTSDKLLRATA